MSESMQKMLGTVLTILVVVVVLFTIGAGMVKNKGTAVDTDVTTEVNKATGVSPTIPTTNY